MKCCWVLLCHSMLLLFAAVSRRTLLSHLLRQPSLPRSATTGSHVLPPPSFAHAPGWSESKLIPPHASVVVGEAHGLMEEMEMEPMLFQSRQKK